MAAFSLAAPTPPQNISFTVSEEVTALTRLKYTFTWMVSNRSPKFQHKLCASAVNCDYSGDSNYGTIWDHYGTIMGIIFTVFVHKEQY